MLLGLVGLARCALTRFKEKDKKAPNGGEARKSKAYPLLAAAAAGLVGLGNPLRSAAGRPSWWGGGQEGRRALAGQVNPCSAQPLAAADLGGWRGVLGPKALCAYGT